MHHLPVLFLVFLTAAFAHAGESAPLSRQSLESPASQWSRDVDLREMAQERAPAPSPLDRLPSAAEGWNTPQAVAACTAAVLANGAAGNGALTCPGDPSPVDSRANVVPRGDNFNRRP